MRATAPSQPWRALPWRALARSGVRAARLAIDALIPPSCPVCDSPVSAEGLICSACFPLFRPIVPPLCNACGLPLAVAEPPSGPVLCPSCASRRPLFGRARAVWLYGGAAKDLVLRLKYADREDLALPIGRFMARAGEELLREADLLIPVPLHLRRLVARRYNQAALLAHVIARASGVPAAVDALRRTRATPPLADLSREEREASLIDAFVVAPRWRGRIAGKRVVLIDDVLTSGATAEACTDALFAAGAASVDVLAAARTPPPRATPA